MVEESLYQEVKNQICDMIFKGQFKEHEKIPAERILSASMGVSRITLRKALDILEKEGLIEREVGRGTRICLPNRNVPGSMDMIVLIAPASNPFFSEFIKRFQEYGQQKDAMILYVEKPRNIDLAESMYRIYQKGLRNIVVWLEDLSVDHEKMRRLRALGMNMVFFDTDAGFPYADCVALDNRAAILGLYHSLQEKSVKKISFVGWDNPSIYSNREREEAFKKVAPGENIIYLPWKKRKEIEDIVYRHFTEFIGKLPEAFLCTDQECGASVAKVLQRLEYKGIYVASVDNFAVDTDQEIVFCKQDFDLMIQKIFACLQIQNDKNSHWEAKMYDIKGIFEKI